MMDKLRSFFTARCPICHFREGTRAQRRSNDWFLSFFFIYPFECRSCNRRFRAFQLHSN